MVDEVSTPSATPASASSAKVASLLQSVLGAVSTEDERKRDHIANLERRTALLEKRLEQAQQREEETARASEDATALLLERVAGLERLLLGNGPTADASSTPATHLPSSPHQDAGLEDPPPTAGACTRAASAASGGDRPSCSTATGDASHFLHQLWSSAEAAAGASLLEADDGPADEGTGYSGQGTGYRVHGTSAAVVARLEAVERQLATSHAALRVVSEEGGAMYPAPGTLYLLLVVVVSCTLHLVPCTSFYW